MRYDDFSTVSTKNGDRLLLADLGSARQAFMAAWQAACAAGIFTSSEVSAEVLATLSVMEQLATLAGVKP